VLRAADLRLGSAIDVRVEDGRIVVNPVCSADYDLQTLVAGITTENRHEPTDWGPPVGRECW
jgi:antitoxin MazE